MKKCTKCEEEKRMGIWRGPDALTEALRQDVREKVELILKEELDASLGAGAYDRVNDRLGYRHGSQEQEISTALGKETISVPRGRYFQEQAGNHEWHSHILPRYAKRAKSVNAALIGMYLGGVNTRRIKTVLRPLLRGTPLSKSAISCLIQRLKEAFASWKQRPLEGWRFAVVYMDAIYLKARFAGRVSSIPVLAAIGVTAKGEKVLITLDAKGSESQEAWQGVIDDLIRRGMKAPRLAVIDGNPGLRLAIELAWPKADVQRCAVHKLRNLLSHAPKHAHDAIRNDFHAIVYSKSEEEAKEAYDRMLKVWRKQGEAVARSLEEAGEELLTFFRYPESQWKALRTTNAIERLNQEFRRRVKTQGSFPNPEAALIVLFGLVASGHVRMRRIDGWQELPELTERAQEPLNGARKFLAKEVGELIAVA